MGVFHGPVVVVMGTVDGRGMHDGGGGEGGGELRVFDEVNTHARLLPVRLLRRLLTRAT